MTNKIHDNGKRVKKKIHVNENILLAISNLMKLKGFDYEYQVAEILGLSSQSYSNHKKRGTILHDIFDWAINEKVNLELLFRERERGIELPYEDPLVRELGNIIIWAKRTKEQQESLHDKDKGGPP